jgi:hypothetical protein
MNTLRGRLARDINDETGIVSIFDPVLCELVYRWFAPVGGLVLDPFAGGSVRGIVAEKCGLHYTGIDLSGAQLEANRVQAQAIGVAPTWIEGDARDLAVLVPGEYDLIFSCPPYADLEVYSNDPRDLSTLQYPAFIDSLRQIVASSVAMLKPNRFAVFVVGEVRSEAGTYHGLVPDTVRAFEDAGARLYNEAILVTAVGSLALRVGRPFVSYRKLGKTHQNVLVFYKGDPQRIPAELGEVLAAAYLADSLEDFTGQQAVRADD